MTKLPVALFVFNRPNYSKKVIDSIKKYQPKKLYVYCDGSRVKNAREVELEKERKVDTEINDAMDPKYGADGTDAYEHFLRQADELRERVLKNHNSLYGDDTVQKKRESINKMYDFIETSNCKNIALVGHNSFISMMKYGKFLHLEDGEEELKHCSPYFMELKFD